MKKFPTTLTPTASLSGENLERISGLIRQSIYDHLVSRSSEEEFFDAEGFRTSIYTGITRENFYKLLTPLTKELRELGWKTKISFGGTGLFIYSSEDPPRTCW